jgi:hypothetical protein
VFEGGPHVFPTALSGPGTVSSEPHRASLHFFYTKVGILVSGCIGAFWLRP